MHELGWIEATSVDDEFLSNEILLQVVLDNLFYFVKICGIDGSSLKMDEYWIIDVNEVAALI